MAEDEDLGRTRGRPNNEIVHNRKRVVEALMMRGHPRTQIVATLRKRWGLSEGTVHRLVDLVLTDWKVEFSADPDRVSLRTKAIKSLEQARLKCHEIIHDNDATRTHKLTAIARLAAIERELARVGGYGGDPDVDAAAKAPPVLQPAAQATQIPAGKGKGPALIGQSKAFDVYLISTTKDEMNETIDAEVVEDD